MKELLKDIEKLVVKHKFTILCVIVITYLIIDWKDIKQGLIDG